MSNSAKQKIIVILGPTASGKSELAVRLVLWLRKHVKHPEHVEGPTDAEIISADSRQVYRGLDIGTGKVPLLYARRRSALSKASTPPKGGVAAPTYKGVRHHLIDFVNPKRQYSVAEYQSAGLKILHKLFAIGHLPIICGGTGLYIDALLSGQEFPAVPPDWKLRRRFDKLTAKQLFEMLRKLDPRRAQTIDRFNKRRLIRALEIILKTGRSSYSPIRANRRVRNGNEILKIGIKLPEDLLKQRIQKRLLSRLRQGLIREVQNLHARGINWKRLDTLGLEYRYVSRYLRGLMTKEEMVKELEIEIRRYAKRQMTWFKRDSDIHWFSSTDQAEKFLIKVLRPPLS